MRSSRLRLALVALVMSTIGGAIGLFALSSARHEVYLRRALGPDVNFVEIQPAELVVRGLSQNFRGTEWVSVRNRSSGGMLISNVSTTCGCVHAALDGPARLAPGDAVRLRVDYSTGGEYGTVRRTVKFDVGTSLGQTLHLVVPVLLTVDTGLILHALLADFGIAAPSSPAHARVIMSYRDGGPPIAIERISDGPMSLNFVCRPLGVREGGLVDTDVDVTHAGIADVGLHTGKLKLWASGESGAAVELPYKLIVRKRIWALPPLLNFGMLREGDRVARRLLIGGRLDSKSGSFSEPVEMEWRIEPNSGWSVKPMGRSGEFLSFEVERSEVGVGERELSAVLTFETHDVECPELRVDLRGIRTTDHKSSK